MWVCLNHPYEQRHVHPLLFSLPTGTRKGKKRKPMNVSLGGRPLSGRRRNATGPASGAQRRTPHDSAAALPPPTHQRRTVAQELEAIPTADELDAQMKLFGRLHDDQTHAEWLGLGQPSTVEQAVAQGADDDVQQQRAFLRRYRRMFRGGARLLGADGRPDDLLGSDDDEEEDAVADDGQLRHFTGNNDNNNDASSDNDASDNEGGGGGVARRTAAAAWSAGASTVRNSWQAELAMRRAALESGVTTLRGSLFSRQLEAGGGGRRDGGRGGESEDVIFGKQYGEPESVPPEPHYVVGRASPADDTASSAGDGSRDRSGSASESDDRSHSGDEADHDGDGAAMGGSGRGGGGEHGGQGFFQTQPQMIAAPRREQQQQQQQSAPPRAVPSASSVARTPFQITLSGLLTQARRVFRSAQAFAYGVEQSFWEETQRGGSTRSSGRRRSSAAAKRRRRASAPACDTTADGSAAAGASSDGDDGGGDGELALGAGDESQALQRLRAFLERALYQLDFLLAEELPEPDAPHEHEKGFQRAAAWGAATASASASASGGGGHHLAASGVGSAGGTTAAGAAGSLASSVAGRRAAAKRRGGGGGASQHQRPPGSSAAGAAAATGGSPPQSPHSPTLSSSILLDASGEVHTLDDRRYGVVLSVAAALLDRLMHQKESTVQQSSAQIEQLMARMRELRAECVGDVMARDEALGESSQAVEAVQGIVRAAARIAMHFGEETVFRGVVQTFLAATRAMHNFARDIARIGEISLLDTPELRRRLEAAAPEHQAMVVALLELADAIETQPVVVPRHAQWRRRALDELYFHLQAAMTTLGTLQIAADAEAERIVSTLEMARQIRSALVDGKRSLADVAADYVREASVTRGVALAIAARRKLRELGRACDGTWGFSCW